MNNVASDGICLDESCSSVYADIFSQAVTGELVGMLNFTALVDLYASVDEKIDAVEHAFSERGHALAFSNCAKEMGLAVKVDLEAPYWARIREAFMVWARRKDLVACILAQELMLESFAISLYQAVGEKTPGAMGKVFTAIGREEEEHLEHAMELMRAEYKKDGKAFEEKVSQVHASVMTALAEMVTKKDGRGHCGLCQGTCVKESLPSIGLNIAELRGRALRHYLGTLDRLGLPGEQTLQWVAKLPL
jgi:fatty aldehyde decarbonylase